MSKHSLIMLLCCLIPLAVLGVLWVVGTPSKYLVFGVLLLCPLLHFVAMRGMHKGSGDGDKHVH